MRYECTVQAVGTPLVTTTVIGHYSRAYRVRVDARDRRGRAARAREAGHAARPLSVDHQLSPPGEGRMSAPGTGRTPSDAAEITGLHKFSAGKKYSCQGF